MKKLLLGILGLFMFTGLFSQKNVLGINTAAFAMGEAQLFYERGLTENISIRAGVPLLFSSQSYSDIDVSGEISISAFGIIPEVRYYFAGNLPKGFYVAPYAVFRKYSFSLEATTTPSVFSTDPIESVSGKYGITMTGVGILSGYQFLIGNIFTIDLNLGAGFYNISSGNGGYTTSDGTKGDFDADLSISGILPRFGLSFGAAF
jgi:hypothetical protein